MRHLLILALAATLASAQDWQTVFRDDFNTGQLDRTKWSFYPPEAALPAFDAREGGFAVHPRTETSNRGLGTMVKPMAPYRLSFDFNQPASEASGYRMVVHHSAQGGGTWWFELDKGNYAAWTTYQGGWAPRWSGPELKTDTWYRLTVENEPLRVRFTIRDGAGQVAAQSDWIAHDSLGEPNGLSFEAASGGGLRGCLFDNVELQAPTTAAIRRMTFGVDEQLHAALAASRLNPSAARVKLKAEGLALELDADGVARRLSVDGTSLLPPSPAGGFYAADIARGSQAYQFRAILSNEPELRCPELKLRLKLIAKPAGDRLDFTATVQDETGQDRALLVYYVLPVDAKGMEWGDSLTASRPIAEEGRYDSSLIYGLAGASGRHLLAPFPWGTLTSKQCGLMVARPLDWPRLMTWMYDFTPQRRCLVIRTELGLSALTRKFPSRADFRFALSRVPEPAWGMRAAARRYYALYPGFFTKRVEVDGLWHLWVTPKVPQPEDFALVFHEQEPYSEDRITFDDQHNALSFTYSEPNAFWQRCTSYDQGAFQGGKYLEVLKQRAAQPASVTTDYPLSTQPKPLSDALEAQAALNSALGGADGAFTAVWPAPPDRVCLGMNSDPELPHPNRADIYLDYELQPALKDPRVDGAYLDSLGFGGMDHAEDFRKEHWATADFPLVPSFRANAPCQLGQFTHQELYGLVARLMRERGKYLMANTFPSQHLFTAHLLDMMGAGEGADLESFHTVRQLGFCRALAYHKPLSHMNYGYFDPKLPIAAKERAIQRNLLYGVWPGSGNVGDPAQIEPLRPLYKRTMPLFRRLGQAGWEPIPYATVTPEPVVVERYGPVSGPLFLVVHNPAETPARAQVTLAGELKRLPWRTELVDAVSGQTVGLRSGVVRLDLKPWQTVMLELRR